MPPVFRAEHEEVAALIRPLLDDEVLDKSEYARLGDALGLSEADWREHFLLDNSDDGAPAPASIGEDEPTILFTSLLGAKGLSAAHVFVVGSADEHFPRNPNAITDEEICSFLVALSRTRKQCHGISCDWLRQERRRLWAPPE